VVDEGTARLPASALQVAGPNPEHPKQSRLCEGLILLAGSGLRLLPASTPSVDSMRSLRWPLRLVVRWSDLLRRADC